MSAPVERVPPQSDNTDAFPWEGTTQTTPKTRNTSTLRKGGNPLFSVPSCTIQRTVYNTVPVLFSPITQGPGTGTFYGAVIFDSYFSGSVTGTKELVSSQTK